ncbi:uncharacterized protein LOC108897071 [Lates calcarifer]|uniref:Uncharacterized protein LOC108897071 n=1 Tax=Lates calcarifer TaxID=8187 RepID=A0AAJ7QBN6_LATCA|nr:uncharacterized protein LOC108897071 [Lates calcarifer]
MLGNIALYSRSLVVSLLLCSVVMSFIISDAARASPMTTQEDNRVKHNILSSLFPPYSQRHPLSTGPMSTETGLQTGTNDETDMSWNSRGALSIIDHRSNPQQFIKSNFGYYQNNQDNRQAGITRVPGEARPGSSTFSSHSQNSGQRFERPQSRLNYHSPSQKVGQTVNSYNSYPPIIRKSSQKEAGSPFYQVWVPTDAQKSNDRKVPRNNSPKLAMDKTALPLQTSEYWSTSLPSPRGHYSGYKETDELAAVRAQSTSTGVQSSKYRGFSSQTAPHVPSISVSLDESVIKHNPSPEKLTPSITDFSQGLNSVTSSKTLKHKRIQSYLFKDSQTSLESVNAVTGREEALSALRPSDAHDYGRFASNVKQLHRKNPTKKDPDMNVAQTDSFTKNQLIPSIYPPTQLSLYPASGKGRTVEIFVPDRHAASQGNSATSSKKSVVESLVNATTRGLFHGYKPGQSMKNIYGIRGFEKPVWPASKEHASSRRINSRQYSFDKGKDYKFKIANTYPSLSPKYSFGQRRASTTSTMTTNPKWTHTDYSPPSSGSLDLIQTTAVSTPGLFRSDFKDVQPLLPERDASKDSSPDQRQFRISKRIYGLKGFGTRPLEGAKPLVKEQDTSGTFEKGFGPRSSQIWQLKRSRIHRWYNRTGETEPETSNISSQRRNELSSEDFKPLLQTEGNSESVEHNRFTPDKYKKNRKIYSFLGFQPIQNRIGNAHKTYTEKIPKTVSSAYLRSVGGLRVESSPKSEPRTPSKAKAKPVAMRASLLNGSTSSMVRARRVKEKHVNSKKLNESTSLTGGAVSAAIVRLPKPIPTAVKDVTYAAILGSASFSSVRATTQVPLTPADKDYFPNATATTKQKEVVGNWTLNSDDGGHSRENMSRSPEAKAEEEVEDLSSVEENKPGFKSRKSDSGMKTFDCFLG